MPSEPHQVLYPRLREIAAQVKAAVDGNDLEALPGLVQAHKEVMAALRKVGFSNDPTLLGLITEIRDRVQELIIKIEVRHDEIGQQLKASGTKRKLDKAYRV